MKYGLIGLFVVAVAGCDGEKILTQAFERNLSFNNEITDECIQQSAEAIGARVFATDIEGGTPLFGEFQLIRDTVNVDMGLTDENRQELEMSAESLEELDPATISLVCGLVTNMYDALAENCSLVPEQVSYEDTFDNWECPD